MKKILLWGVLPWLCACAGSPTPTDRVADSITVAAYYFPGYHTRDTSELPYSLMHPHDWTEWELVKAARPRFADHAQPHIPAWGYEDERDPAVMARKIDAAADHGLDVFIFDWYYYNGRPFLNRALDEGFLGAPNKDRMRFALMWANHGWTDRFPYTGGTPYVPMYDGKVTPELYDKIGDELVAQYFTQPNYWKIDGKAYFSIYDVPSFLASFGSVEAARTAMESLDAKARAAGLKGVHWNMVVIENPKMPDGTPFEYADVFKRLGVSSVTTYIIIHQAQLPDLQTDYNQVRDEYLNYWAQHRGDYSMPYIYNVTMGWDSSPRTDQTQEWSSDYQFPYWNIMRNNTPENFKTALQMTRDTILAHSEVAPVVIINAWNEWTESSYLEPDTVNGMAYLEAVREVFPPQASSSKP